MANKEIFWIDGENPKMIEAFKNAQDTFKYFWRELSWEQRRIVPALALACVKIAFTQDEKEVEHMWINEVTFDGNNVTGILLNEPDKLTNVSCGDFVNIPLNQITDWLFAISPNSKTDSSTSRPKVYGGFTIQAIRSEMTAQERKEHDDAWGLDFGDYNEVLLVYKQKEHPENLIEHPMSKNAGEKLIDFLTKCPNEITKADEHGFTLLHREAIAGNLTSVEVLLSMGVDKNAKTNRGETALDLVKKVNWQHIIPVLEK